MKHKEYIIPIGEEAKEFDEIFIGVIRKQPELIRCKDCKHWARNDGMFRDIDEREWHHCPHLGIDTDGYFSCIEGERKEE